MVLSQNIRRDSGVFSFAITRSRNRPENAASLPYAAGKIASIRARKIRAMIGAAPPDEMAITKGERSIMEGVMKSQYSVTSATLASTWLWLAMSYRCRSRASSSVAP